MICSNCKKEIDNDSDFCEFCGVKVARDNNSTQNIHKEKVSKKKVLFLLIILLLGGFLFYWYESRPAKIKHDCSWVKEFNSGRPADPGITLEEVEQSKKGFEKCKQENKDNIARKIEEINNSNNPYKDLFIKYELNDIDTVALSFCDRVKEYVEPKKSESPRDEWRRSTEEEYEFCLHDKGL